MKKIKKLPSLDNWLKAKLRRITREWPGNKLVYDEARIERGLYKCQICGKLDKLKSKDRKTKELVPNFHKDHIEPIVPLDGKIKRKDDLKRIDWNIWIDRCFLGKQQLICVNCHETKTELENEMRKYYKEQNAREVKTSLRRNVRKGD